MRIEFLEATGNYSIGDQISVSEQVGNPYVNMGVAKDITLTFPIATLATAAKQDAAAAVLAVLGTEATNLLIKIAAQAIPTKMGDGSQKTQVVTASGQPIISSPLRSKTITTELSDTVDLPQLSYVRAYAAGNIKFMDMDGNINTRPFDAKEISVIPVKRIYATGTDIAAANLAILY